MFSEVPHNFFEIGWTPLLDCIHNGHLWGLKKGLLYGDVRFIEIPYKNEYLAKINQEWVFEVNGFHKVKKGHVEWNEKCFYFKNNKSNATTSKQKSEAKNNDISVDWNQVKYDVIYFSFLFWSCKFSNFWVTVDNIL